MTDTICRELAEDIARARRQGKPTAALDRMYDRALLDCVAAIVVKR